MTVDSLELGPFHHVVQPLGGTVGSLGRNDRAPDVERGAVALSGPQGDPLRAGRAGRAEVVESVLYYWSGDTKRGDPEQSVF